MTEEAKRWEDVLAAAAAAPQPSAAGPDFSAIPPAAGYDSLGDFSAEVARLAALPEHEYERGRKAEAKRLGVRVGMLDAAVKAARPRGEDDGGQGKPIELPEIDLHPDPVDGAELLGDLTAQIQRFIVLPEPAACAVSLWVMFAHAHDAAFHSPRLALLSPVHRCGKSTLSRVIGMLVVRKVSASSVTASATFRLISAAGGLVVLLIDEFDQVGDAEKAGELVAVINAGHCRLDAYVIRTVPIGGDLRARRFDCWAPAVVASNKALPVTWMDRSIVLRMKRKARGDRVERLRDDLDLGFDALAGRAARWAADHLDQLRGADPALPAVLNDRQADNWRLLIAIADLCGGDWGKKARDAAVALSIAEEKDNQARGELLLSDIRDCFAESGADRVSSMALVTHLNGLQGRPWAEFSRGASMSQNQLANLLRPFGIAPSTIRLDQPINGKPTGKGYLREAFEAAWDRYLSQPTPAQTVTTSQPTDTAAHSAFQTVTTESSVTVRKNPKATASAGCDVVTVRNPPEDEKGGLAGSNGSARHPEVGTDPEVCPVCGEDVPSWELTTVEGATMCLDCAGGRDDGAPASPGFLTCSTCNGLFPSTARGLRPEQRCPDCRRARAAAG